MPDVVQPRRELVGTARHIRLAEDAEQDAVEFTTRKDVSTPHGTPRCRAHPRAGAAAAVIGSGTLMAVAPGQGILAHRNADGSVHTYMAVNGQEEWLTCDMATATKRVVALFDDWAAPLRALVAGGDAPPVVRPIHALPASLTWPRVPGVTLLGDAAHLMSPFAGEGANLAMIDGAELARAISDHPGDREAALAAYERDLFARSGPVAQLSAANRARFFGPDAPTSVVGLFAQ